MFRSKIELEQQNLKVTLHNELLIKHKEYFESELAIQTLKHPEYFMSVSKVSANIIQFLLENKNRVLEKIVKDPKILIELRIPYFGSCYDETEKVSALEIYEKIISILKDHKDLSSIMQIHCIFSHRIYDQFRKGSDECKLKQFLSCHSLFSEKNRKRVEISKDIRSTTKLGITRQPIFEKKLTDAEKKHNSAIDQYQLSHDTDFYKDAVEKAIPIVCGPSGHTKSLLLGAKSYGKLTADEVKEYALACFSFLAAGGHHSFHEVFTIAKLMDIPYVLNHYATSIPVSIKKTTVYKHLQNQFSQFLKEDEVIDVRRFQK